MNPSSPLYTLLETLPQVGRIEWMGIRPARGVDMIELDSAKLIIGQGLEGDRFNGRVDSPRQVTLIQYEHLGFIASCTGHERMSPALLRRNIVVSGINLLALKNKVFRLGDCELEMTGLCHPCSKMEKLLGAGGYNAMRGHGGITAKVLTKGVIRSQDPLIYQSLQGS
ncbi:MAG: MOSC domain-containing protein YiiM [Urechidicola sp.]|jgi:MOSC domain-containing protein YiiM